LAPNSGSEGDLTSGKDIIFSGRATPMSSPFLKKPYLPRTPRLKR